MAPSNSLPTRLQGPPLVSGIVPFEASRSPALQAAVERLRRAAEIAPDRRPELLKGDVAKGTWLPEEDAVLEAYVEQYGEKSWNSIQGMGLLQRPGKSCRLRWKNQLQPGLQRNGGRGCKRFSKEEELAVLQLQKELGNKWARIAEHLPGRTDNDVKNFWNLYQKKLEKGAARIALSHGVQSNTEHHVTTNDQRHVEQKTDETLQINKTECISSEAEHSGRRKDAAAAVIVDIGHEQISTYASSTSETDGESGALSVETMMNNEKAAVGKKAAVHHSEDGRCRSQSTASSGLASQLRTMERAESSQNSKIADLAGDPDEESEAGPTTLQAGSAARNQVHSSNATPKPPRAGKVLGSTIRAGLTQNHHHHHHHYHHHHHGLTRSASDCQGGPKLPLHMRRLQRNLSENSSSSPAPLSDSDSMLKTVVRTSTDSLTSLNLTGCRTSSMPLIASKGKSFLNVLSTVKANMASVPTKAKPHYSPFFMVNRLSPQKPPPFRSPRTPSPSTLKSLLLPRLPPSWCSPKSERPLFSELSSPMKSPSLLGSHPSCLSPKAMSTTSAPCSSIGIQRACFYPLPSGDEQRTEPLTRGCQNDAQMPRVGAPSASCGAEQAQNDGLAQVSNLSADSPASPSSMSVDDSIWAFAAALPSPWASDLPWKQGKAEAEQGTGIGSTSTPRPQVVRSCLEAPTDAGTILRNALHGLEPCERKLSDSRSGGIDVTSCCTSLRPMAEPSMAEPSMAEPRPEISACESLDVETPLAKSGSYRLDCKDTLEALFVERHVLEGQQQLRNLEDDLSLEYESSSRLPSPCRAPGRDISLDELPCVAMASPSPAAPRGASPYMEALAVRWSSEPSAGDYGLSEAHHQPHPQKRIAQRLRSLDDAGPAEMDPSGTRFLGSFSESVGQVIVGSAASAALSPFLVAQAANWGEGHQVMVRASNVS